MKFLSLASTILLVGAVLILSADAEELETGISIARENGGEWIYFPGRDEPVGFPYNVYIEKQFVSTDGGVIVFLLSHARETTGADFYGLLFCHRTEGAWRLEYKLFSAELYLKFGKRTWVESVYDVSNPRRAMIKIASYDKRLPPSKVLRTWEVWDIVDEEQIAILGPADTMTDEPPEAIKQQAKLGGEQDEALKP